MLIKIDASVRSMDIVTTGLKPFVGLEKIRSE